VPRPPIDAARATRLAELWLLEHGGRFEYRHVDTRESDGGEHGVGFAVFNPDTGSEIAGPIVLFVDVDTGAIASCSEEQRPPEVSDQSARSAVRAALTGARTHA